MASTYRFYVALTLGDGVSKATAFKSKLANFITANNTQDFWDWSNRAWPRRFCLALCDSTKHSTIAADPDIVALSPELADLPAVATWLDGAVGSLPANIATAMENGGIPTQWISATTTRREIWRFIAAWHFWLQRFSGALDNDALNFLKSNLDNTVSQVPVAAKNRISTWMVNNSLDTGWITGATAIRNVVTFIILNGNFTIMKLGPVTIS